VTALVTILLLIGWLVGLSQGVGGASIHLLFLVGIMLFLGSTTLAEPSTTQRLK